MSSSKAVARSSGAGYQAKSDLNNLVEEWALKNAHEIRRSCASCTYAHRSGPFKCSKYDATPPIDVIMNGCDGYSDCDDIPF